MSRFPGLLRAAALVAVVAGAAGSLALMFWVGHRKEIALLLVVFAVWVLAPFVALLFADRASKRWSAATRTTLHGVMLIVALVSLAAYGVVALGPPRAKPAAVFLVIPLASWLFMTLAVSLTALLSGRPSRHDSAAR